RYSIDVVVAQLGDYPDGRIEQQPGQPPPHAEPLAAPQLLLSRHRSPSRRSVSSLPHDAAMEWTVLVPVKALPGAKSRLAGFSAAARAAGGRPPRTHAWRPAGGGRGGPRVGRSGASRPAGPPPPRPRRGLTPARPGGARLARDRWPADGVAGLVGDLPALTPA